MRAEGLEWEQHGAVWEQPQAAGQWEAGPGEPPGACRDLGAGFVHTRRSQQGVCREGRHDLATFWERPFWLL